MSFEQQLKIGKTGEGIIAQWMRRRGFNVLPVYEIEQGRYKGPALYSVNAQLIAPDMLAFTPGGDTRWIEAKTKSAFTWHRITERWVTGIDLRHYQDYLQVQVVSPWSIWLLFLHLPGQAKDSPPGCPSGLFGSTIDHLSKHENHRHPNGGHGGMVYWAYETLRLIAPLDDVIPVQEKPVDSKRFLLYT